MICLTSHLWTVVIDIYVIDSAIEYSIYKILLIVFSLIYHKSTLFFSCIILEKWNCWPFLEVQNDKSPTYYNSLSNIMHVWNYPFVFSFFVETAHEKIANRPHSFLSHRLLFVLFVSSHSPLSYYPLSCYPTPCSLVLWCSSCYAGKRRDNDGGREKNRRGCLKTVRKSNFLKAWVKLVKLFENDVKVKFSKTLSVKMIEHFYFGCSR